MLKIRDYKALVNLFCQRYSQLFNYRKTIENGEVCDERSVLSDLYDLDKVKNLLLEEKAKLGLKPDLSFTEEHLTLEGMDSSTLFTEPQKTLSEKGMEDILKFYHPINSKDFADLSDDEAHRYETASLILALNSDCNL